MLLLFSPKQGKTEIKALLDAEIAKVNPAAPESIVLFASEIVAWVNAFPAIAAEILGSSMKDFFHFATWQNRERAITKTVAPLVLYTEDEDKALDLAPAMANHQNSV